MLVRSITHLVDGEPGRQCVHCHGFVWRQQPKRLHVKDDACDVWDGGGAPREEVGNGAVMSVAPWLIRAGVDAAGEPAWRQRGQCKEPPPPPLHPPCAASLQMLLSLLHSRTASAFFQGTAVLTLGYLVRQASPQSCSRLNSIYGTVVPLALAPHPAMALSFFSSDPLCLLGEREGDDKYDLRVREACSVQRTPADRPPTHPYDRTDA